MSRLAQRFRSARFLILDRNQELDVNLGAALRAAGAAQVEVVSDLRAWLTAASRSTFDVLVGDWDQPGMSGLELVDRLRLEARFNDAALMFVAESVTDAMSALVEPYRIVAFVERPLTGQRMMGGLDRAWSARQNPSEFQLLLRRGLRLLEEDAFEKALMVYNWLRQVEPESLSALFGAGQALSGQGQLDDARRVFEEVVERCPLFLQGYAQLGAVAEKQGDSEAVFRVLQAVVGLTPNRPDNLIKLARKQYQAGQQEASEATLRAALGQNPALWEASLILTDLLLAQDRLPEATELVDAAQQHHPGQTDLFNNLGIALRRKGRLQEAERSYATALAIQPDNAVLLYNAAVVDFLRERDAEAVVRLDRALAVRPDLTSAKRFKALLMSDRVLSRAERMALFT